jgi:hypothetical protein
VAAFAGAGGVTAAAGGNRRGAPSVPLAAKPSSVIWAVGRDSSSTAAVKPSVGQSLAYLDHLTAGAGTGWVQAAPQVAGAARVRVSDSAPVTANWELIAIAITPVT